MGEGGGEVKKSNFFCQRKLKVSQPTVSRWKRKSESVRQLDETCQTSLAASNGFNDTVPVASLGRGKRHGVYEENWSLQAIDGRRVVVNQDDASFVFVIAGQQTGCRSFKRPFCSTRTRSSRC